MTISRDEGRCWLLVSGCWIVRGWRNVPLLVGGSVRVGWAGRREVVVAEEDNFGQIGSGTAKIRPLANEYRWQRNTEVAREWRCSKAAVIRRLKLIRRRTGISPRLLRRQESGLKNLDELVPGFEVGCPDTDNLFYGGGREQG